MTSSAKTNKAPAKGYYERDSIAQMQGYVWGEQPQHSDIVKLNTNENPYPPSPAVAEALANFDPSALRTYPNPTADPLRQALATHHNLTRENVVLTHGGDEALRLAITTFVDAGETLGIATPSYSLYPVLATIQDAKICSIPLRADYALPSHFADAMQRADVKLTLVVNPHAPSGQLTPLELLRELAEAVPGVLLIDEAYVDFVDPAQNYDSSSLLNERDNVLIMRTFSKGYSLAGMRLGYLLGAANLIKPIIEKTRDSYNIDALSQAIGLAAIQDQAYAESTWSAVRGLRDALYAALLQRGFGGPSSQTNFLFMDVPATGPSALAIYQSLKKQNILVRYFEHESTATKLRFSVGTAAQNTALLAALDALL
tara:strand:+ start:1041 stop:2153 length:1113 start_codon:yes stop_codon:yes gene_type:complete